MSNNPSPIYIKAESGPFKNLQFLCHPDQESYDKQAGYTGAMLEDAHRWHIHRNTINVFDEAFAPIIEKISGIPRRIDEKRTETRKKKYPSTYKISPVYESFPTYANRVFAQISPEKQKEISDLALSESRKIQVDVTPTKSSAPIEPMFYKRAESLLSNLDLASLNLRVSNYLSLLPDFELARDENDRPIRESLARLLQQHYIAQCALED